LDQCPALVRHQRNHRRLYRRHQVYVLFDTRGYLPLLGSRPKITLS